MDDFRYLFSVSASFEGGGCVQFAVYSAKRPVKVGGIISCTCELVPLSMLQSEILFMCMADSEMVDKVMEHAHDGQRVFILSEHGVVQHQGKDIVAEMKGLVLEGILSGCFAPIETKVNHRDQLRINDMVIAVVKQSVH